MADIISRLKLESGEFNSNIKRAGHELLAYSDHCRKVGLEMGYANRDAKDFARQLGSMATQSHTARGKINELTETFTNLKVIYNSMTDAEKKGEFGRNLSASLDQLKTRIGDASGELKSVQGELGGGLSDALDKVAGKFGLNISQLTGWGAALAAGTAALNVAKDAFFACETNVDDWGRAMASTESVYNAFLYSLNNSDFSGFLTRMDDVIRKAQEAYNAMDELGTRMTIISPERAKLQVKQTELKATIRREGKDSEAGRKAQQEIKALEPQLQKAYQTESKLNYSAFAAEVDKKLAEAGILLDSKSKEFLMNSFSSDEAYQRLRANAKGELKKDVWQSANGWGSYKTDVDTRNVNQKLLDLFTDEWRQQYSPYLTASYNAKNAANSILLANARYVKDTSSSGGSGGKGGSADTQKVLTLDQQIHALEEKALTANAEELALIKEQILALDEKKKKQDELRKSLHETLAPLAEQEADTPLKSYSEYLDEYTQQQMQAADKSTLKNLMDSNYAAGISVDMSAQYHKIQLGLDVPDEAWEALVEQINERRKELGLEPIVLDVKTGGIKETEASWKNIASAVGQVGSAMQSIEDPAAKIAGIVAQAVATLALTYAKSLDKTFTPWDWIAAAAAGAATMLSSAAAIKSATSGSYAEGGIVRGSTRSGDMIPGWLNDGELVLNSAQQNALASELRGGAMGNMRLSAVVTAEQIRLVLNNNARRTGRGEALAFR